MNSDDCSPSAVAYSYHVLRRFFLVQMSASPLSSRMTARKSSLSSSRAVSTTLGRQYPAARIRRDMSRQVSKSDQSCSVGNSQFA